MCIVLGSVSSRSNCPLTTTIVWCLRIISGVWWRITEISWFSGSDLSSFFVLLRTRQKLVSTSSSEVSPSLLPALAPRAHICSASSVDLEDCPVVQSRACTRARMDFYLRHLRRLCLLAHGVQACRRRLQIANSQFYWIPRPLMIQPIDRDPMIPVFGCLANLPLPLEPQPDRRCLE